MTQVYTYPCVFYYEADSKLSDEYRIHICFPDFIKVGIPASTVSKSKDGILMTARELLQETLEIIDEEVEELPAPTLAFEDIDIDRRSYFEKLGTPFRIEIVNISAAPAEEVEEVEEAGEAEEEGPLENILSGRIQDNKCIISSIGGVPIREGAYTSEKLRSLYRAISSEGESIALNFNGKRVELNAEQSLMLRHELAMIADELDKE